jgi:hypothetical protein
MNQTLTIHECLALREPVALGSDTLNASVAYFRANPEESAVYVRWDNKCIPEAEMLRKCGFSRTAQLVSIATDGIPMRVSRKHKHVAAALRESDENARLDKGVSQWGEMLQGGSTADKGE